MKRIFLLFGLIFSCGFCFAFPCVTQFVEAGTGYVAAKNVEREFNPFNFTYGIAEKNESCVNFSPNFKVFASVQFSDKIFDFTTLGNYFIPRLGQETDSQKIGFGAELVYHFQRYYDLYSEHDIYLEGVFRLALKNRLLFLANLGSGLKFARIDAVDRDFLWDFSLSGSVALNYYFDCGAEILARLFRMGFTAIRLRSHRFILLDSPGILETDLESLLILACVCATSLLWLLTSTATNGI